MVLAAVDKQLAALERCPEDPFRYAMLTLRMPLRPDPTCRMDWHPVRIRFRLPPHAPATAVLCAPTLRVRQGRLLIDVPYALAVAKPQRAGHRTAVAFGWGLNTLLTGGALRLTDERQPRIVTDGKPAYFRAGGVLAKADRLRVHSERISARIDQLRTLIASRRERGQRPDPHLAAKLTVLEAERKRVARRRTRLNAALARAAARFVVDHAIAAGASVIYLEDLEALDRTSAVHHQTQDRTKSGPTNKHPVPGKRRKAPAPPGNRTPTRARPGGKRPAGRTPTHPTLPQALRAGDTPWPAVFTAAGTDHHRHPHPATPATPAGRGQTRGRLSPPRPHHPRPKTAVAESAFHAVPNTRDSPGNPSR
ncbi:hypothetical protein ACWDSL_25820 [Streptomyces sp. NPDC000941]